MFSFFNGRQINLSNKIETGNSLVHGRGVFAVKDIKRGEVIETAPLILISAADKELLQTTILFGYYFLLDSKETPAAIALGYASLYNHAYTENAEYKLNLKKSQLHITACTHIGKGEEIFLNYNGRSNDNTAVHF